MLNLKRTICLGLFMILASMMYSGNDMFELIVGGCWIIGAIVFFKQIIRLACEIVKFVWLAMGKVWEYFMRL